MRADIVLKLQAMIQFGRPSLDGAPLEGAVAGGDAEDEGDERHEHLAEALLDAAGGLRREGEKVQDAVVRHVHQANQRLVAQLLRVGREEPHLQKISFSFDRYGQEPERGIISKLRVTRFPTCIQMHLVVSIISATF